MFSYKHLIVLCIMGLFLATLVSCAEMQAGSDLPVEKSEKMQKNMEKVIDGNTILALDLYKKLAAEKTGESLFFSPYSISTALAMTWIGARGETAEQMADTLQFNLPQEEFHPVMGLLQQQLNPGKTEEGYQLHVANALWGQKNYAFLDSFIRLNKTFYHAGLNRLDFAGETEKSRQTINDWVEEKTNDKIQDLIKPGVLDAMTRLVLTNAIYFKGKWEHEFDPDRTEDAPFYTAQDESRLMPMMKQKKTFGYGENEKLQVLEMPYKGEKLSMVVLLPKDREGLAGLEKNLTAESLRDIMNLINRQEVVVTFPKFKMTVSFSLKKVLSEMGMKNAFDNSKADFSGMTGKRELFISAIVHKAFVEVNEEGTEAAAATGVIMTLKALPEPPKIFRADHPFIFIIKDNPTGSILFMGRMTD